MNTRAWFPAIALLLAAPSLGHAGERKLNLGEVALKASQLPFEELEPTGNGDGSRRALVDGHYVIVREKARGRKDVVVLGSQRSPRRDHGTQSEYSVRLGAGKAAFVRAVTTLNGKEHDDVTTMRFITPSVTGDLRSLVGKRPVGQSVAIAGHDHDHENYDTPRFKMSKGVVGDHAPSMKSLHQATRAAYGSWKGRK